jgi:hypothetical protein
MSQHVFRTAAASSFAGLVLTGCSLGSEPFSAAELETTTLDELSSSATDDEVVSVTCDGELQPEVGATQTCHGSYESGLALELRLEVESIVDDTANFTYTPVTSYIDGEGVADQALSNLTEEGYVAEDVECEQIELIAKATAACTATVDGDPDIAFMALMRKFDPATGDYTMLFRVV